MQDFRDPQTSTIGRFTNFFGDWMYCPGQENPAPTRCLAAIGQNAGLDHLVVLLHREFLSQDLDGHERFSPSAAMKISGLLA